MKVCILKGPDYRHNYFAKEIISIDGITPLVLTHERSNKHRLKQMILKSPKTFLNRASKYLIYYINNWNKREKDYFGNRKIENEIIVENYNSPDVFNLIKEFNPDVIAVFGTPIISNAIINLPKYGSINLHGGISPEYKGGNTIFWALYNGDIEKTGATIHFMVEKVDSGDILAKIYPDLKSSDDEFSASAKTFKYSTEVFVDLLKWINKFQKKPIGIQQEGKGSLYLAKDRTAIKDFLGFVRIKKNLSNIDLKKRIELSYE